MFGADGGVEGDAELIVNERFVAVHLSAPGEALGSRLALEWLEGHVVGVIRDLATELSEPALPKVYVSTERITVPGMAMLVRTVGEPAPLLPEIQREIRDVSNDVLLEDVTIIGDAVRSSVAPQRFNMLLVTAFAALALTLAAVGIYGVTSLSVATCRSEIGIRRALGASDHRVAAEVARRVAGLSAIGVMLGTVGALASGRLLSGLLFGVSPTSPAVVAQVVLVLGMTAGVAGLVPVLRAVRVDPTTTLRGE
jgi:putative ABC transport system permease protein